MTNVIFIKRLRNVDTGEAIAMRAQVELEDIPFVGRHFSLTFEGGLVLDEFVYSIHEENGSVIAGCGEWIANSERLMNELEKNYLEDGWTKVV